MTVLSIDVSPVGPLPALHQLSRRDPAAAELLEEAEVDALAHLDFPVEHRRRLRTDNVQERANRETRRRSRVVQVFPSTKSLIRLIGAVCCEIDEDWSSRCHIAPDSLAVLKEDPKPAEPIVFVFNSSCADLAS